MLVPIVFVFGLMAGFVLGVLAAIWLSVRIVRALIKEAEEDYEKRQKTGGTEIDRLLDRAARFR